MVIDLFWVCFLSEVCFDMLWLEVWSWFVLIEYRGMIWLEV